MIKTLLFAALLALAASAQALTTDEARELTSGDTDARIAALARAMPAADARTAALLQALVDGEAVVAGERVLIVRGERVHDAVTGAPATLPEDAEEVVSNNRLRGALEQALATLRLFSADAGERRAAVAHLQGEVDASQLPLIERALAQETDPAIQAQLGLLRASAALASPEAAQRLAAATLLADSGSASVRRLLLQRLQAEPDAQVRAALQASVDRIERSLAWGERIAAVFSGVSLGSILLLVALGLAITYGLMGVINMAHGELMMIGAYATWGVQTLFRHYLPEAAFDAYLLAAVPAAFAASALVGAVLERGVIRHLYGRPLETLLATWGISLVLMQGVRSLFGAQNVGVENPSWMSGGIAVSGDLQLPWNRVLIVVFALVVLAATAAVIGRTRLGLFVRGVTQNRPIAACMGVNTARVDTGAFAFGSGLAGLAGCALSQVGNVGPDLGQRYIVDAFMVVVLGGVGQIAGTVYAALGLGVINKLLEGWTGAVLAKIAVLVFIVVFIQKRPQGLFAVKGRTAEA